MSNIGSYTNRSFSESQKFLVLDPSTGTTSLVLGSDLVNYITPQLNAVNAESTRLAAENTDYAVGEVIQTTGATSPGDNFAAVYLVVEGGTGDFPMINGNDLLVIRGDEFLREQLIQNTAGVGSDLVAHTGTSDTVTEALDKRTVFVGSVAELEAITPVDNDQVDLTLNSRYTHWTFSEADLSTEVTADPNQDYYIAPSSDPTGASGAWVRQPSAAGTDGDIDSAIKYDYPESKASLANSLSTSGIFWKAETLYDPGQQIQVLTDNKRLTLGSFNDEAATSNVRFGEGAGANKYENMALVNSYIDGSAVVDGSDNFANIVSLANKTQYIDSFSYRGTVGFSMQKNYDLPVGTGTVDTGAVVGNIAEDNRTIGFEFFGASNVAAAGNSAKGDGSTFIGFRFTGDTEDSAFSNALSGSSVDNVSNGLSVQADADSISVSGIAISNVINGVSMPDVSGASITGNSRFGRYTGTINEATSGLFLYGPNYSLFDFNVVNCSLNALREETLALGDLKSNRYDLGVYQSENIGTLDSSNTIIRVVASDIQRSGLIIAGSHNHVTLVVDNANLSDVSLQSFQVTGSYNTVDVISTGNPTLFDDITISGDKNQVRLTSDSAVAISGDNNVVSGFAASFSDTGTGNNTTGLGVY